MGWLSNIGRAALGVATGGLSEFPVVNESLPFIGGAITNQKNREFASNQLEYQKTVDARNFANQDRQFNEQSYLNRNGIQLQAADAQKAGINPLAMSSGTLSTASASNVSSSTVNGSQPSVDSTGALMSLINIATQKSMNSATNETSEKNTESNNKTAENINAQNNQTKKEIAEAEIKSRETMHLMDHNESVRQFDTNLQHAIDVFNSDVSFREREIKMKEVKTKIENDLLDMQASLSDEQLREACYDFAKRIVTGLGKNPSKYEALGSFLGFNFTRISTGEDPATQIATSMITDIENTKRNRRGSK